MNRYSTTSRSTTSREVSPRVTVCPPRNYRSTYAPNGCGDYSTKGYCKDGLVGPNWNGALPPTAITECCACGKQTGLTYSFAKETPAMEENQRENLVTPYTFKLSL